MNKSEEFKKRLIEFTISVLKLSKKLPKTTENNIFFNQTIRSSSSIGANYCEAMFGHSKLEFIHSINISRKEANESVYWLELIEKANPDYKSEAEVTKEEGISILKILIASVRTARLKLKNE